MNLRSALATIHRDPQWWRKILIGGALMLSVIGYPWVAGFEMESLENTRKGFPAPLPPWREWSLRYLIGLFATLIDFLFFGLPIFMIGLLLLCLGAVLLSATSAASEWFAPIGLAVLLLYLFAILVASISPIGRLIYADAGRVEDALGMRTLRQALEPQARRIYLRARLRSLPAYLPALALLLAGWYVSWPLNLPLFWLACSALFYAHLIVVQLYAAAERDVKYG